MSDGGTGEKTEEASPQKLKQARDKGQVAKSQDATQAFMFIGVFATTALNLGSMRDQLSDFIKEGIDAAVRRGDELPVALNMISEALWVLFLVSIPTLGAAMVCALVVNYAQVGVLFTSEPLKPDFNKLNPVNGFKQLFSKKKLVESLKQLLKFIIVSYIGYDELKLAFPKIILATRTDLWTGVAVGGQLIYEVAKSIGFIFVIFAAADFFWQRHIFKKDLMMSKYDVKQEYKQSEGDPQHKAERKSLAEELILHGSQENVANADAVITNPAHIAVAIKYDKEKGTAPVIVAKGQRKNAETIKEIARQAGVPILRNIPLAQALNQLDLNEEVPEDLYEAVAEVLNFVYELKEKEKAEIDARSRRKKGDQPALTDGESNNQGGAAKGAGGKKSLNATKDGGKSIQGQSAPNRLQPRR